MTIIFLLLRQNYFNMESTNVNPISALRSCFEGVTEYRKPQGKTYYLEDLLAASILAILSGADDFTAMSEYCKEKHVFLQKYFRFKTVPSHDLFRNVYAFISPDEFYSCFIKWTNVLAKLFPGEVVPIDGKALRATREGDKKTSAIYIVSAWASENGICLGQARVDKKSNEKTAIPELLKALDIEGCTVTIDAMGSHPPIAKQIVEKKADYILALKKTTKTCSSK